MLICFLPLWLQAQNEHLQQDLEHAFLNADPKLLEVNMTVDDYIAEQFRAGNYETVLEAAPYHLYGRMALVSQIYFSLSEQERTDLSILIEGNLIFHYILSAMVHTNNTDIAGFIYDYLLFVKQLQLRTEQKINYAIKKSGNQQLLSKYAEYRNIKKQLAESHPSPALNRDALQKRLNSLGRQLAQQSNLSLEDDADLWIDIQKRLGNGEAAIEFVRFNVFEGEQITSLHQYAAIVVTQHCKTPMFIQMPRESAKLRQANEELKDHFSKYRINDALMTVYKLFWDEFSQWYLEMVKPAYVDGEQQPIDRETYNQTLRFFELLLKMLHPFMPFITEELWQALYERQPGDSIMRDELVLNGLADEDTQLIADIEQVKQVVSGVRTVRSLKNIAPKEKLELHCTQHNPYEAYNDIIVKMANLEAVAVVEGKDATASAFMVGTDEFSVPLGNLIDVAAEIAKLESQLQHLEDFLEGVKKKLANERFVQNAPEAVVNMERKKQADSEEKIAALRESIAALKQA